MTIDFGSRRLNESLSPHFSFPVAKCQNWHNAVFCLASDGLYIATYFATVSNMSQLKYCVVIKAQWFSFVRCWVQVLDHAIETEKMIEKYESLASDLLEWIEQTIIILNNRKFANSLVGVQQQLQAFNTYRTVEKPPKSVHTHKRTHTSSFTDPNQIRVAHEPVPQHQPDPAQVQRWIIFPPTLAKEVWQQKQLNLIEIFFLETLEIKIHNSSCTKGKIKTEIFVVTFSI